MHIRTDRQSVKPEFAHPYQVLSPHIEVFIASPTGTTVCDPKSVERWKDDEYAQDFFKNKKDLWTTTDKLSSYLGRAEEFDVIFVVGGFGRMSDPDPYTQSHDGN